MRQDHAVAGRKDNKTDSFDWSWGLEHHAHKRHLELIHLVLSQPRVTSSFLSSSEAVKTLAQPFIDYSFPEALEWGAAVVWYNFMHNEVLFPSAKYIYFFGSLCADMFWVSAILRKTRNSISFLSEISCKMILHQKEKSLFNVVLN